MRGKQVETNNKEQVFKTAITSLFALFCFLVPQFASAAVLFSQSANQDVYEGQTFVMDWFLDTEGRPINSLDLKINYSQEFLEVQDVSAGNSLVNLWIKLPTADNEKGLIELIGGIVNGTKESKVPIFHSVFKVKKSGTASVTLNPGSVVLLNDGHGTSEPVKFRNVLFNIYPEQFIPIKVNSPSHPDQNIWYSNRNVEIKFTPKPDTDYSFSFSSNVDIIPEDKKIEIPQNLSYNDMPDGVYYFKLNSKVSDNTWQEAAVFRAQIDATAPESFLPLIASDSSVFDGKPFVSFSTLDKMSGISHYKVKVGLFGDGIETQSPYQLHKPLVGDELKVTAYDQAGNLTTVVVPWRGYLSVLEFKLLLIFLGLAVIIIDWIVRRQIKKKTNV